MSKPWSYDAIAAVYATDMGASMTFDDVGWYRALCTQRGGRVLELGCGSGRILLELLAADVDATGIDRSLPMLERLREDARRRGLDAQVAQMDLRALAIEECFDLVLAPYSLVTYLTADDDVLNVMRQVRDLLAPGGMFVVDAFVPRPVDAFDDFQLDYRRAHGDGELERHKRIQRHADGRNRIERRYRVYDRDGALRDEFFTDETIRPYAEDTLATLGRRAGLVHERTVYDYAAASGPATAPRFATLLLRRD